MISFSSLVTFTTSVGDWLLAVLCLLCALAHLACLRSPDIQEQAAKEMGRRIKIAGLILISMSWWMRLINGEDIPIAAPVVLGYGLVFFGELLVTTFRLYEHRDALLPKLYGGVERRKPVVATVLTTVTVTDPTTVTAKATVLHKSEDNAA
jgi:hypothetical protein